MPRISSMALLVLTTLLLGCGRAGALTVAARTTWLAPTGNDSTCSRGIRTLPCATFDRAFQISRPGDTVQVEGGTYPVTDPGADAIRIDDSPSMTAPGVTFGCASGPVNLAARWFTIKAHYVTIRGACFKFHTLRFGEPGDTAITAQHIVIDGASMENFVADGPDDVQIRNSNIGPSVACYPTGTTGTGQDGGPISPSMWCDPSKPAEAFYVTRGKTDGYEDYIHPNSGRQATNIALVGDRIHDQQTKDAFNLHTGGLLLWQGPADGNIVFRDDRWDRNAIYNVLAQDAAGVTFDGNSFAAPVEPLSNDSSGSRETLAQYADVTYKTDSPLRDWIVRRNSFAHGFRPNDDANPSMTYSNVVVSGNIFPSMGCAAGAPGITYTGNWLTNGACGADSTKRVAGYQLRDGRLHPAPGTADAVRFVFARAASGDRPAQIARRLRRLTPRGSFTWTASQVRAVIGNPVYLGNRFGPPGAHPALVRAKSWNAAQRTLNR
jgi:Recombinase